MRQLTLRVEDPRIEINGQGFSLRMSDMELYARVQELLARCTELGDGLPDPARVLAAAGDAAALLDAALGEGAVARISGGRPVSLPLALEWLGALAREAAEHYTELLLAED